MPHLYLLPEKSNSWLTNKLIKESTDGYLIIAKLHKKGKVIIKLSVGHDFHNEYSMYLLLHKIGFNNPNVPKIYGIIECYEKNKFLQNINENLLGKGLCNGSKDDKSSKISFTVIERIEDSKHINEVGKFNKLQTLSLIWQGMFQLYMLYYIFGIIHNDFNTGNILVTHCSDTHIEYNIIRSPYRYFTFDIGDDSFNKDPNVYKVPCYGVKLVLIDFDQAICHHYNHINVKKVDIKEHVIDQAFKLIQVICGYGDESVYKTCKQHFDTRGKHLMKYCEQFFVKFNKELGMFDNSDESKRRLEQCSDYLIDRCRVTYRMWMRELNRQFIELQNEYLDIC